MTLVHAHSLDMFMLFLLIVFPCPDLDEETFSVL